MSEEKKKTIQEFGEVLSRLPEKEQNFVLGRIEGYKAGYDAAKKEIEGGK